MDRNLLESIAERAPVLSESTAEHFETGELDQQWLLLTEAVRQEILSESATRTLVTSFIDSPVSEALPAQFIEKLSSNARVAKLIDRFKDKLGTYLKIDSVPDEQLQPDITHAKLKYDLETTIKYLQSIHGDDTPEFYSALQERVEHGTFLQGVTVQEKTLVAQRYRFARDVKMLALQAAVAETPIETTASDSFELPGGTTILLNVEDEHIRQDLLNPQNWERRKQIKDRVYAIQVGKSYYILKEKKTARHTDTKKSGHTSGLTSYEEFETAKDLQTNGQVKKGNVSVTWERPVATVKFPDEYQFTVFEYEPGLLKEDSVQGTLRQHILENAEQFLNEYEAVCSLADTFYDSPQVLPLGFESSESSLKKLLKFVGLGKEEKKPVLTFDDFTKVKALRMTRQSRDLMIETMIANGYRNGDLDGYAYKINQNDLRLQLEICGFDFEYYKKIDEQSISEKMKRHQDNIQERETRDNIGFRQWDDGDQVTRVQRAGYLALLATEGIYPKLDAQ